MTEKPAEQYESSIRLAADSTGQLRKTDVFRVVEDADDRGFLEEFAAWLSAVRPDLVEEIAICVSEI